MRVIICGAGRVGAEIASYLVGGGNEVIIIDHSKERIDSLQNTLDVRAVYGFASHPKVLAEVDAQDADMIIAVTLSDEINMIACLVAHSVFGVKVKIARIREQNYLDKKWFKNLYSDDGLPIDLIISPELEVAKNIFNRISVSCADDSVPIADDAARIMSINVDDTCLLLGDNVEDIQKQMMAIDTKIIGINRDDFFFIPGEKAVIKKGDQVYFIIDSKYVDDFCKRIGYQNKTSRNVVIVGGGIIGLSLAKKLESNNNLSIAIVELSNERAKKISSELNYNNVTVINGNAMDYQILDEAGVENSDTIITVSNDDQVNILSALIAKKKGCRKAIALNNNHEHRALISSIGIDTVINPREITISTILQYIRKGNVKEVHSISDGAAEVIEIQIDKKFLGKMIEELDLPKHATVCCVIREKETYVVDSRFRLKINDLLVLISCHDSIEKIDSLLC